ncbi:hypothetical protein FQR65_LT19066 [Abscondita terminalis]|nr:hypothetical protein FQR65_LT09130 [Abscondita terminalis]KAF5302747.1 hypothetical protein FQR65_LT19066 [Abscondita terminalis]
MAPNNLTPTGVLFDSDEHVDIEKVTEKYEKNIENKYYWIMILLYSYFHVVAVYGLYLVIVSAKIWTTLTVPVLYFFGILGITAGVHRLWSHRSYKATWQLRLLLTTFQTLAFQDPVIDWARDHRVHHKYNETDADPYNINRGFFFSHIGWMFVNKHPAVRNKGQGIDSSDLFADPFLAFQKKYYFYVMPIVCFILPTFLPMYLWDETFTNAYSINILRYVLSLNSTLAVNSFAHRFGSKPYDKNLNPSENLTMSLITLGEGWHNYHHAFPWDYKTSELGIYSTNITTLFIDLMAKIGWAYDLKTASEDMIKKRVLRTGDGSHDLWGWGDKDQTEEDRQGVVVQHPKKE